MNTIPDKVKLLAEQVFCGEPEYIGELEGSSVYSEYQDGEAPAPTGLPAVILWNGSEARLVSGIQALGLLSRLQ